MFIVQNLAVWLILIETSHVKTTYWKSPLAIAMVLYKDILAWMLVLIVTIKADNIK